MLKKYYFSKRPFLGPEKATDYNYFGFDFNLESYLEELNQYKGKFQISKSYSTSYQGKEYFAIELDWKGSQAKKKMLLTAGMHGNEISGVFAVPKIVKDIYENPEHYKDWEIKIISPVNPVGAVLGARCNKDGYDINRDFDRLKTEEARQITGKFLSYRPDLTINFHEGPQKGFMILATHRTDRSKLIQLAKRMDGRVELATKHYLKVPLAIKGLAREGLFLLIIGKLIRAGNFEQIIFKKGHCSITTENCWQEKDKEKRTTPHFVLFREAIDLFK